MADNDADNFEGPPLTQEQEQGKSQVQYAWVILFHYSINDPKPFSMVPLSFFAKSNFPWSAVKGILSPSFRCEKQIFPNIPGKTFTIFAKVEMGMNNDLIFNL